MSTSSTYRSLSPDAEQIAALVCHYPRQMREARRLLMLRAFIDDSGNSEYPFFVLAGFVSTPARWEVFSDEWRAILNSGHRVRRVKSKEIYSLTGQFFGCSPEERDEKLALMAETIKRHAELALVTVIPYYRCEGAIQGNDSPFSTAHILAFYSTFGHVVQHAKYTGHGQKTSVVFDNGIMKGRVKKSLETFWSLHEKEFSKYYAWPPTEADDEDMLPLQAADLMASSARRSLLNRIRHAPDSAPLTKFMDVTGTMQRRFFFASKAKIKEIEIETRRKLWDRAVKGGRITYTFPN